MRKLALPSASTLMMVASSVLLVSCAAQDDAVPPGGSDANSVGVGGGGVGGGDEPCTTDGDQRECSVHNAYGCLEGTQTCQGGTWSDCAFDDDATEDRILRPSGDGARLPTPTGAPTDVSAAGSADEPGRVGHPGGVEDHLIGAPCTVDSQCGALEYCAATNLCALIRLCGPGPLLPCPSGEYCSGTFLLGACAAVAACGEDGTTANPCDAECHALEPQPLDFGVPGPAQGGGSFNNYPAAYLNAGLPNNCNEGVNQNDCQFDHYCSPVGNGECVPWESGQNDTNCSAPGANVNVTIGRPCADGIPICNRGTAPLVDDFHLDHSSSAGVSDINSGDPNLSGGGTNCDYDVAVFGTIEPGQCVMMPFDCGTPATNDDFLPGEIITAHNPNDECNDGDNFGYYATGANTQACNESSCGGGVNVSLGPVDLSMFTLIDRSASMAGAKVDTVCRGIRAFTQDAANINIGFEYKEWPDDGGSGCGSCCGASGGCDNTDWRGNQACWGPVGGGAYVGLQPLPGTFASPGGPPCTFPGVGNATYNSGTALYTPLLAALRGARHSARIEKLANPDKAVVIVLVTDAVEIGGNDGCSTTDIRNEVEEALDDDGVFTAVVGIGITCGGAACDQANNIADWGGTGQAIFLPGSGSPTLLNQAMQAIRNSFSCSRSVPDPLPSGVSFTDLEVTFNNGGTQTPVNLVGGGSGDIMDCTGGPFEYYYDGAGTMTLCPVTCGTVTGTIGTNVEYFVPCGPQVVPVTGIGGFSAPSGACPQGHIPKWTQVITSGGSYPGGSEILIEAHTKIAAGDSFTTEWVDIATISGNGVTDLFTPLDNFNPLRNTAITPVQGYGEGIELQFTSTPGSIDHDSNILTPEIPVAPAIGEYEVHFTCEATE